MGAQLSGSELLQIKKLMGQILRNYYHTNDIVIKAEYEEKYRALLERSRDFKNVVLTSAEEEEIVKINLYTQLFEEYNTTSNVIRKAEIEEIFKNITNE